ncbi:MAG: LysR family transcriptional regulator, partial [Hyphomicrobiales bacterium]|nr:LysR family transcriptional regulator [Hyphomicrobiales bacterium]
MNWDDFRIVRAVAEAKSLVGAAQTLGLNHSTVFRRLGAIEIALGSKLFERSRLGYAPTAAGEEMIELARKMGEGVVDFERRVAGRDVRPSGELRITTVDSMIPEVLAPVFAGFRAAYPDVTLDVIAGPQALNLAKRDADVAIRATNEPGETLVGRRVATLRWRRYGSRAAIERDGPDSVRAGPWVGFGDNFGALAARNWMERAVEAANVVYRQNTVVGMAEMIASGIGQGMLPAFLAKGKADLAPLSDPDPAWDTGLWLLTHQDLRKSARIRA